MQAQREVAVRTTTPALRVAPQLTASCGLAGRKRPEASREHAMSSAFRPVANTRRTGLRDDKHNRQLQPRRRERTIANCSLLIAFVAAVGDADGTAGLGSAARPSLVPTHTSTPSTATGMTENWRCARVLVIGSSPSARGLPRLGCGCRYLDCRVSSPCSSVAKVCKGQVTPCVAAVASVVALCAGLTRGTAT